MPESRAPLESRIPIQELSCQSWPGRAFPQPLAVVFRLRPLHRRRVPVETEYEQPVNLDDVDEQGRLRGDDDLPSGGQGPDHAADQGDLRRMKAQLRLVEQNDAGQQVRGKVEKRHQGECPQRTVRPKVRAAGLVAAPWPSSAASGGHGAPRSRSGRTGQDPTDAIADALVPMDIVVLQECSTAVSAAIENCTLLGTRT